MRTFDELETLWATVPAHAAQRAATLRLVVDGWSPACTRRHEEADLRRGGRPGRATAGGHAAKDPDREAQVTLMNATVAELVAADRQPTCIEAVTTCWSTSTSATTTCRRAEIESASATAVLEATAGAAGTRLQQVQRTVRPGRAALGQLAQLAPNGACRGATSRVIERLSDPVGDEVTRIEVGVPAWRPRPPPTRWSPAASS